MALVDFYVERTEKGYKFFKPVKGLFNKMKKKEVSADEFFAFSRNLLKERGFILPKIKGISKEAYMDLKASYGLEKAKSDFGQRTKWSFLCQEENAEEIVFSGYKLYQGNLKGIFTVRGENNELLLEGEMNYPYIQAHKMTPRMVELLLQNSSNGIYTSARDIENFNAEVDRITGIEYSSKDNWICEECGKTFKTIDEFFCHLIEEKHQDSVLETHPYDKECIFVKNQIEK